MGGKSSNSTQQVSVPAQVLAQYSSVNALANQTAAQPFQQYGGEFVAGNNSTQLQGVQQTSNASNEAQQYYANATPVLDNAYTSAQGYNANAQSGLTSAQAGTQPYNATAAQSLAGAQSGTYGANNAALGLAGASAQQVNATPLTGQQINSYLSPYLGDVLGTTNALANQNNDIAQSGELGNAISSGAFGGDRTGIAAANLNQQNQLAEQATDANILNTGYQTALGTAQQQQGVNLAAGQANRAALGSAGSELASIGQTAYGEGANTAAQAAALGQTAYGEASNTAAQEAALGQTAYGEGSNQASALASLGTGAQTAALQGANAEIGAGTVEQQTQQAQDTAEYNQFLQQQSYPFQVDQFLANIAEGTGALSGSTTTTTQPGGFFSDKRLKSGIRKIGKTFDGQDIVSYKMPGDDRTRMGLIAQDVEEKHPHAVGLAAGFKTVDYGKATEASARKGHFARGGVAGYAGGGYVDPGDLSAILQAQQAMYGNAGLGAAGMGGRGGMSRVPQSSGSTPQLVTAGGGGGLRTQPTGAQNVATTAGLFKEGQGFYKDYQKAAANSANSDDAQIAAQRQTDAANNSSAQATMFANNGPSYPSTDDQNMEAAAVQASAPDFNGDTTPDFSARGGRIGLAAGGSPYSSVSDDTELNIPDVNSHNQLAKAPDLPKQAPTGFQQLMSMGSGMGGGMGGGGGGGGFSSMFSGSSGADAGSSATSDAGLGSEAVDSGLYMRGGLVEAGMRDGNGKSEKHWTTSGRPKYRIGKDDGGSLDENNPSQQQGDSIDTAPPLAHAGANTSLDSVKHAALAVGEAYIGDYAGAAGQVYDAYNSTQQNNGPAQAPSSKRGGVVGARHGYADGGSPADDADPTQDTDVASGAGVAPAGSDITGGPKGTPWYKDTGKLIPLAQALAAMGTAPTRHLGVALAAGLGAGASSYQQQQEALAKQGNEQAKTQGVNLANQLTKQKLSYLTTPPPKVGADASTDQPPQSDGSLQGNLRSQYYIPRITVQEASDQQYAHNQAVSLNSDEPNKKVQDRINARLTAQDYKNKQDAQNKYDDAVYTYNHSQDPNLKASAASAADAYHQYTGDKPVNLNGVNVNERTTQPFIGAEAQRLSPDTYTRLIDSANELVTRPAGDPNDPGKTIQVPRYRANGAATASQYVASLPPPGTPDVPGRAPVAAAPQQRLTVAPRPVQPKPAVTAQPPAAAAPAVRPGQQAPAAAPSDFLDSTVTKKAFSDPSFKISQPGQGANQIGTTFGSTTTGKAEDTRKARVALQSDADATVNSSSAAIQYAKAAQQILQSKDSAVVGKYGPAAAAISAYVGDGHDAANYQELSKYLGNLAIQSAKNNFSNSTDKNTSLQFEQLNPSTANNDEALNGLLKSVIRQNEYVRDTANRTTDYLSDAPGGYNGRAQDFFKWNQKYFPRESVNVPKAHLDDLVKHPEHAADFKKQYGYLPGGG